jgi:maltose alpha-D-glucosyltransferase/alpha-amylase
MPFQPTPNRDDGYDISDHYGVDPRLGTLGEFVELVRTAGDRGIGVIVDLVRQPHLRRAPVVPGRARRRPAPDWYVWRDEPSDEPKGSVFPDKETSNWAYDRKARKYYLHRFYSFQPDLDTANPEVREEIARVMGFWLQLGVAGFRLDAVPALLETAGLPERVEQDPQEWLRHLRSFASRRRGDAMLLGEVNVGALDLAATSASTATSCTCSRVPDQPDLWLALARQSAEPLETILRELPVVPPDNAWSTFLRNHDELDARQADRAAARRGLRRVRARRGDAPLRPRHPPARGADARRRPRPPADGLEPDVLAAGRADDPLRRRDRPRGGPRARRPHERARADGLVAWPSSGATGTRCWEWMRRLLWCRRDAPEVGWGTATLIESADTSLFAQRVDWQGSTVVTVHNLGEDEAEADLELGDDVEGIDDLLELREHKVRKGRLNVKLGRYGYLWLRLRRG